MITHKYDDPSVVAANSLASKNVFFAMQELVRAAVPVAGMAMHAGLWVFVPCGVVSILLVIPGLYTYEHSHKIGFLVDC